MKIKYGKNDLLISFKPERKIKMSSFMHWHENIEFLYILNDNLKIVIDGELYEPKKGDIIFIPEFAIHYFICDIDDCSYLHIGQLSLSLLIDAKTEINPVKKHIKAEELKVDPVFEKQIIKLIEIMKDIEPVKKNEINPFAKSIFTAFYFALMEKFPEINESNKLKKERIEFYKIVEYLNKNYTDDINVAKVSKQLYMERGKLSKIFLKYSGVTINDYVKKLRITKVNEMIEEGVTITEAAFESGFQSIRTFNEVYKSFTGVTPSQHLKKFL